MPSLAYSLVPANSALMQPNSSTRALSTPLPPKPATPHSLDNSASCATDLAKEMPAKPNKASKEEKRAAGDNVKASAASRPLPTSNVAKMFLASIRKANAFAKHSNAKEISKLVGNTRIRDAFAKFRAMDSPAVGNKVASDEARWEAQAAAEAKAREAAFKAAAERKAKQIKAVSRTGIPDWAQGENLSSILNRQYYGRNPDAIFSPGPFICDLEEIFKMTKSNWARTSSENWHTDRLTVAEKPAPSPASIKSVPKEDGESYDIEKSGIPDWARGQNLSSILNRQYSGCNPDTIFSPGPLVCDLEEIFKMKKSNWARTSSENWHTDRLTVSEKLAYERAMGYNASRGEIIT